MKNLVIVESPTKAKTISKFLGKDYTIESSFGHIRDLPKKTLGVDVENNFEPTYEVPAKAKKHADILKKLSKNAETIYFATDEDREGEAIAWHLAEIIKPKKNQIKRIVFHEITKDAILEAIKNPTELKLHLVDAQQARRILDRLVGYKLSPLLWKKIARGLSAGRVQSVAVRIIVEREREIEKFKPQEYWTIDAEFEKEKVAFEAKLSKIDGKALGKFGITNDKQSKGIINALKDTQYSIAAIEKKKAKKKPLPPFTTSTLQQTANNRLGFSAKQTMRLAQMLYEGVEIGKEGQVGLITYMRTDSLSLSEKFVKESGEYIKKNIGQNYTNGARAYKTKSKSAQEAHEAIRPTEAMRGPQDIKKYLEPRQYRLYKLIWQRAVASQMSDAIIDSTGVDIVDNSKKYLFRANGSTIQFDGFLKVYPTDTKENILPELKEKDSVDLKKLDPTQHFTQPPARYSEATLVKALEEKGIGRPSTYAPTISTVQDRNYVTKKDDKRLHPTEMGVLVNDVLVAHFPRIVDYEFTAKMEDDLDEIAKGQKSFQKTLRDFYEPFNKNLMIKDKELNKKEITEEKTDEKCEKCSKEMVIKMGRFGKFLACTGYPDCKNTKQIVGEGEEPSAPEKLEEKCPECKKELVKRRGKFGEFIGCSGYPDCKYIKKEPAKEFADCPKCGKGKIVAKHSKRGAFYACDQYPDCKNAYWAAPTGKKCLECESLMIHGKDDTSVCSNKECGHKE